MFIAYQPARRARAVRYLRPARSVGRFGGFARYSGLSGVPVPAWQVDPKALRSLARLVKPATHMAGLGSLGLTPVATSVGSKAAAVGATAIAADAGLGSAAGPIGAAAGALIGLALTLFEKQYFNVAEANAACATQEQVWEHYESIQGHVAGRALGFPTMIVIWHGAVGAGLFPLNSQHLSFHEGTLNCAGTGTWSDSFLGETLQGTTTGCGAPANCIPNAFQKFNAASVPSGKPAAVYFVDSILLPMNQGAKIPWITSAMSNPIVHQLLYDVADAYLGVHAPSTVPYVEFPAQQEGTPTTGAVNATGQGVVAKPVAAAPTPAPAPAPVVKAPAVVTPATVVTAPTPAAAPTPAPTAATPAPVATPAAGSTAPAATAIVPYAGTSMSLPSNEPTGSTAPAVYSAPAAAPAGLSTTEWLLIIAGTGVLAYALANHR